MFRDIKEQWRQPWHPSVYHAAFRTRSSGFPQPFGPKFWQNAFENLILTAIYLTLHLEQFF